MTCSQIYVNLDYPIQLILTHLKEVLLTVSSLQIELNCEQHMMAVNNPKRSASNTRNIMKTVVAAGENIGQSAIMKYMIVTSELGPQHTQTT